MENPVLPKFARYDVCAHATATSLVFQLGCWMFRKVSRFYHQKVEALKSNVEEKIHMGYAHNRRMLATATCSALSKSSFQRIFPIQGLPLHYPFPKGTSPVKQGTMTFPLSEPKAGYHLRPGLLWANRLCQEQCKLKPVWAPLHCPPQRVSEKPCWGKQLRWSVTPCVPWKGTISQSCKEAQSWLTDTSIPVGERNVHAELVISSEV